MGARRSILAALATLVLWALAPGAASAQPVTCGQVITQSTRLDADLDCFGTGQRFALVIGAPNITLNLGGHTVAGEFTIKNEGFDGVTIENGSSYGDEGIVLRGVARNTIRNITFSGIIDGLALYDSDRNRIVRNTLIGTGVGLNQDSDGNTLAGNRLSSSEGVIFVHDSSGNVIVGNELDGAEAAIHLAASDHNWVVRNRVRSAFEAFGLFRSDGNVLADNVGDFDGSTPTPVGPGVAMTESGHNLLIRNAFKRKTRGVWLRSGTGNVLIANRATDTIRPVPTLPLTLPQVDPDGFWIEAGASQTLLAHNVALRNVGDGFDVEAPGTRLSRNTANDNGDLGIEAVAGVTDLGGNRASGNGNPVQCLNVVCR
jgi:parallel beta-helix repeat protein